jgi:hypothetical protein
VKKTRAPKARPIRPKPAAPFKGRIGRTWKESKPDYPKPVAAPKGAPNVLLILTDDTGFGHASTFGGAGAMPTLDRLAANGLRYNRLHTTALCSPSRAALLTGRNYHSVGTGVIIEMGTGYPGYTGMVPNTAAGLPEVLRQNGCATACFGKWHNTPLWGTGETAKKGLYVDYPHSVRSECASFPGVTAASARMIRSAPWKSLAVGFAVLVAAPVAAVILIVTLVGLPLGLALMALYVLVLLLGLFVGATWLGSMGARLLRGDASRGRMLLSLLVGVLVLALLALVPMLGPIVEALAVILGIGGWSIHGYRRYMGAPV